MRGLIIGQSLSELIVQASEAEIARFGAPVGSAVALNRPLPMTYEEARTVAVSIFTGGKWVYDEDGRPFGFLRALTPQSRQTIDVTSHNDDNNLFVLGGVSVTFEGEVKGGLAVGGSFSD